MATTVYIYALSDPRTGEVRYIGKTINIKKRMNDHVYQARTKSSHNARWIAQLLRGGLMPVVTVIEETTDEGWQEAERRHIALQRALGTRLTNSFDGGEGQHNPSAETRAKIGALSRARPPISEETRAKRAASQKGHTHSPETKARLAETSRGNQNGAGYKHTPEARARMSAAAKNRSPETRAKMSAAAKARKASPETRARISAAMKGRSFTPETIANMSEASRARSPEVYAKGWETRRAG